MAATTALEFQPPALSGFNHSSGWNLARFSTGNSSTAPVRPEHRLGPASPGLSPSQLGWHNNNATWWWYSGQSEGSSRVAGGLGRCSAPFSPRPPSPLFCHAPLRCFFFLWGIQEMDMMSCMSGLRWQWSKSQTSGNGNGRKHTEGVRKDGEEVRRVEVKRTFKKKGAVEKIVSRRTWRWNMNYRSNLREVVRTLFPPSMPFIPFCLFLSVYAARSLSKVGAFCSLDEPHNNTVHPRWFVLRRLWLCLCSSRLWKKKIVAESKFKTQHVICSFSPSALSCLSLSAFPLLIFLIYLYSPAFFPSHSLTKGCSWIKAERSNIHLRSCLYGQIVKDVYEGANTTCQERNKQHFVQQRFTKWYLRFYQAPLLATEKWSVPLTHTHTHMVKALGGASSVCSCVCLISEPCVKWRGKSVLFAAPTSPHHTDCTPGNWPRTTRKQNNRGRLMG